MAGKVEGQTETWHNGAMTNSAVQEGQWLPPGQVLPVLRRCQRANVNECPVLCN
jgi:hypothetical protein